MPAMDQAVSTKPEYVFAPLLFVFGLAFVFAMPPCQVADEPSHLFRSYQVSEGRLLPIMGEHWGGGYLPDSIVLIPTTFNHLPFHPERQATRQEFETLLATPLDPDTRQFTAFPGATYYAFVPYAPQAVGIAVARSMGFGPLGIFYGGRLANLMVAVLLVFVAIRITPVFKLVLGALSLTPITVHQFASFSPDALTIAVAFLFTAVFFRLVIARDGVAGRGLIAAAFGLAAWLTLCKFPYAVLALFYFAAPPRRLGGWRRYLLVGAALLAMTCTLAGALTQLKRYTPGRIADPSSGASIEKQTRVIVEQPLRYVKVLLATAAEHGKVWLDHLGTLGWLDTAVNPLAMHAFLVFLVVLGLADRTPGLYPGPRAQLVGLTASVLCWTVIVTCCYLVGCAVKAKLIVGPQGRYFIPFLPLLLLLLYNRAVEVKVEPRRLLALAAAVCAGVLLVALASLVRRYYYPLGMQLRSAPAALAAALALVVVVVGAARWRWGGAREAEVYAVRVRLEEGKVEKRSALHQQTAAQAGALPRHRLEQFLD